ncbi:MAG: hypothetical protein WCS96_07965 [Victivallales bacterium]
MKKLLAAVMMMVAVAGFAQLPVRDAKNFKYADGCCYYMNSQNSALPILKDGYWGNTTVRWDSDTNSKYVHLVVNGVEKTLFLVGKTPDRQTQQCLLIKMSNGILRAFALTEPTPEQLKGCINNRKAYEYQGSINIQDGDKLCRNCEGAGYFNYKSPGKDMFKNAIPNKKACEKCKGTGKLPTMILIPEIKIIE